MVLTETGGSTAVTVGGGETTLFDVSGLNNYACTIFLDVMGASDVTTIRVYAKDSTAASLKKIYTWTITGTQDTSLIIPYISSSEYKVTIQMTAGSNRTYNWDRYNL